MFKVTILLILGILLVLMCVIFIYRNFLSQYKMNRNGFITILILLLAIVVLFYSMAIVIGATSIQETIHYLNSSPNIPKDELDMLTKSVPTGIKQLIKYLITGYSICIIDLVLVKIIQKQHQVEVEKNVSKRWKTR